MTASRTRPTISATRAPVGPVVGVVGVGVGAVILDEAGRVLLLRRGPCARNEQGMWACPGGALAVGETLEEAIAREVREECGLAIVARCQLGAFDHVLPDGAQWVSVAYLAEVVDGGEPAVREPGKCSACAWFALDALPWPLSPLARIQLEAACRVIGGNSPHGAAHGGDHPALRSSMEVPAGTQSRSAGRKERSRTRHGRGRRIRSPPARPPSLIHSSIHPSRRPCRAWMDEGGQALLHC